MSEITEPECGYPGLWDSTTAYLCLWPGTRISLSSLVLELYASIVPCPQFRLIYTFPPVCVLPCLLPRIVKKKKQVILIASNWPIRTWFLGPRFRLLGDKPWPLPNRSDLLSQGPLFHPTSQSIP